jgi:hypothetical protein
MTPALPEEEDLSDIQALEREMGNERSSPEGEGIIHPSGDGLRSMPSLGWC